MPCHGFWSQAQARPDRIVLVGPDSLEVSAGELLAGAHRAVHALRHEGLCPGDVLAVMLENGPEFVQLCLAALQAGWYVLPLSPALPESELNAVLAAAKPAFLVGTSVSEVAISLVPEGRCSFLQHRPGQAGRCFARLIQGQSSELPSDRVAGARAFVTSGTTGRPRVVRHPLTGLSPEFLGKQAVLHLKAVCGLDGQNEAVHLVASPLYHSASLAWCLDQLHLGHKVVMMPTQGWDPVTALEIIERQRVTATLMVPTHFRRLYELPLEVRQRYDMSSLSHVVHTGAPCSVELKRAMLEWWGPVIYEVYGASEGPGTRVGPEEWLSHPGTVGRGHGRIRVVGDDGGLCLPGEVGKVYLKGSGPPSEPEVPGFFWAGDLGYLDADDYLYLMGRGDDVIISGGRNLYPAEVESVLLSHPAVADAAVLGVADPQWGQMVSALVQPGATEGPALEQELLTFCRAHLESYKCPKEIRWVASLPRDPLGKLRRRDLGARVP